MSTLTPYTQQFLAESLWRDYSTNFFSFLIWFQFGIKLGILLNTSKSTLVL